MGDGNSTSQSQKQPELPTRLTSRTSSEGRVPGSRRGQDAPPRQGRDTRASRGDEEDEEEEEEEEENGAPRDPYASERAAPSEGADNETTLEAIHNRNRLQAKVMGLQGEALRLTYAIDHINSWPAEWQQKREDLKRAVRAHSSQLQFAVKRAERALLAKIEEGGREADHRFMRAAEVGKQRLRDSLRNVLHEVNVLKGVRELGMDAEVNTMCAFLLGRSVGMEEVALDMPAVALEGLGRKESEIHDMVTGSFGDLIFSEQHTNVFKPEPVDFSEIPVENFVSKTAVNEETIIIVPNIQKDGKGTNSATTEVSSTSPTDSSPEEGPGERRPRKRSTADKRRHMTDLGLDSPDVREYLAQFQTARETFRTRRREILQQGQLGRISAASPGGGPDSGEWGLEAVRARLRSSSREGGRIHSLDRGHPQLVPTGVPVSEIPSLMRRRGSAPVQRSSSMSRLTTAGQTEGASLTAGSKYLSGKPPPSPVREESASPHAKGSTAKEGTTAADFYHSLLSPQLQRRPVVRERRHSLEAVPALEGMSIPAAAELLTQGETTEGGSGYVSSRPIRRAISSAADKRAKIEILRETWHRRREILIQNEGFVTLDSSGSPRQGSDSTGSPRQGPSPPPTSSTAQANVTQQAGYEKISAKKAPMSEAQHDTQLESRTKEPSGLASRLSELDHHVVRTEMSHTSPASAATSYTAMYSSHGGPAPHLVNTVKISIPEVNERVSPIPEPTTTSTSASAVTSSEQPKERIIEITKTEPKKDFMEMTDEKIIKLPQPEMSVAADTQSIEQQEDEVENITTDTFTIPIQVSKTEPQQPPAPAATTTADQTRPTSAAPTYFFKSRLTGLPVGGVVAPVGPPKPTHFFTSRLTGLPVGGPVATAASTVTSSTARIPPKTSSVTADTTAATATSDNVPSPRQTTVTSEPFAKATDAVATSRKPTTSAVTTTTSATSDSSVFPVKTTLVATLPPTTTDAPLKTTSYFQSRWSGVAADNALYTNNRTDIITPNYARESTTTAYTPPLVTDTSTVEHFTPAESDKAYKKPTAAATINVSSRSSQRYITEALGSKTVDSSNVTQSTTITSTAVPLFKSRLTGTTTGEPTHGTSVSVSTLTTTTSATTSTPFFQSRLTRDPVGRVTTSEVKAQETYTVKTTVSEMSESSTSQTARYPSRYSSESRFTPRETVDVASLISAMYKGNEKKIMDTTAGQEHKIISSGITTTPSDTATNTTASATATSSAAGTGTVRRELPPLRSAPAFSYTRRYNLSSSSSPSRPSTATNASENVNRERLVGTTPPDTRSPSGKGIGQTTDSKITEVSLTAKPSSTEDRYSQGVKSGTVYQSVPTAYTYQSSRSAQGLQMYPTTSHDESGRYGGVTSLTTSSNEAMTFQSHKLDYPRAHLPDVIPETTAAKELTIRASETKEEIPVEVRIESKPDAPKETTGTQIQGKAVFAKTNEEVKKSFGFTVDSEISRGKSITDAIRRSSSPLMARYSPATARRSGVPEPLDLQGGAVARSPTDSGEGKEVSSPSSRSPIPSPSSPNPGERGIKGRLKEIARKKKERWRHLTIH